MDLGFAGSTAVVTGGSKGMGLAIAETLAARSAPRRLHGIKGGVGQQYG
jgi:NAD(P)-dependent dehydrogenase (short-subunit alcohol dehydrogenase family)